MPKKTTFRKLPELPYEPNLPREEIRRAVVAVKVQKGYLTPEEGEAYLKVREEEDRKKRVKLDAA